MPPTTMYTMSRTRGRFRMPGVSHLQEVKDEEEASLVEDRTKLIV